MLRSLVLLLVLLLSNQVAAMTWKELNDDILRVESGAQSDPQIIVRLSEIVLTLVSYTKAVEEQDPAKQIFCMQPGGSLNINEIVSMVRYEARTRDAMEVELVQDLMLIAFQARFPC